MHTVARPLIASVATCLLAAGVLAAPPAAAAARPWLDPGETPQQRAAQLVAQMTLDEKIGQMHTTGKGAGGIARLVPGIPRLGVPDFRITNGPAGVGTGSVPTQPSATQLPAPVSLAAAFDPQLARQYGEVEGRETVDVGHSLIEAPDVNIIRVPQSGRDFENYSEDPYLSAQLAVANVQGIQDQGVLAEVKHYDANNQETNRFTIRENVDDRTLHEIYEPPFESAVKQGHVAAVMCAFPVVNGQFMCENKHLLNDVLRNQWGFDGFVQSDAGAAHSAVGSADAGMSLELADNGPYDQPLKDAVQNGQVSMQRLDQLLEQRLATEIEFGLFDHPLTTSPVDAAAGGAVARQVAEDGTVLLKNGGDQLPLDATSLHSIAVIGQYANKPYPGGGGSSHVNPLYTVSPVQGIQDHVGAGVDVTTSDGSDLTEASQQAAAADVAVVVVSDAEREGADRPNMSLTGNQDALVQSVAAANPHTIVVIDSGAPVLMPWVNDVPSILEAWYPGEEDGNALAAVLFGDVNPSGKLPVTFPRSEAQTPVADPSRWPGVNGTATYSEGLQVGYRWYDANNETPLFPFGYGLSYTSFSYSDLVVSPQLNHNGQVTVGVDVTNTGDRAGDDVAQVYVSDPPSAGEPPQQLKAFQRVHLAAGQTKHLVLKLDQRAFSIWNSDAQNWTTVDGRYGVHVGDSSAYLPLSAPVSVVQTAGVQTVKVAAPAVLDAGDSATVQTTFENTGDFPANATQLSLDVPDGWAVSPTSANLGTVPPHGQVETAWQVTAPADAAPASVPVTAHASFQGIDGGGTAEGSATIAVPYPNLAAAFDNIGVTDDTNTDVGNIDGSGSSLSAQALAAQGVTPGATVSHSGAQFAWPDVPSGQAENALADGQPIRFSGSGSTLGFLATATYGPVSGNGTIIYTDGTTQDYSINVPDWYSTSNANGDAVITIPYRNRSGNTQQTHDVKVFFAGVPLQAGKTVATVVLPDVGNVAVSGTPAMHIFGMATS
jgi:beta-glucosidase